MLSNGFAFRLCNLHNLVFRGLDLAYMPSPLGFANRDRPHACAARAASRPPERLLHVRTPLSFAAKLCRRGSGRGEVQDGRGSGQGEVHDGWGPNDAARGPRQGDDGWARNAAIQRRATREELPATKKIARQEKNLPGKKVWAQNSLKCHVKMQNRWRSRLFILAIFIWNFANSIKCKTKNA